MFTIENKKYQLAQKISGVGIWLWNLKDNSLTWDQRLYEIYGVTPTLVGVTYQMWASLVNPEDLGEIELSASRLVEGLSERFDHVFRAKKQDGTPLWIRTIANLYRDQEGHPHEILGANFDVTMEVFYRKALEDEKARLELALQSAELGIWDWDLADKTMHWDPIMVKIWGRLPGVFASDSLHIDPNDWAGVHPEDKTRFQESLRSTLKTHGTHDLKLRIVLPDQSIRFIGIKMRASRDKMRDSTRILGVCQDMTAQTQKDLEGDEQRNLMMQQARLDSIAQLARGVGHDINNPLAIILGFTQKMLRKKESLGLNEEMMAGLMKIQDASNRIRKIIDGLRALAKPAPKDSETKIRVVVVSNDSEQQKYLQEYFNRFECHVEVISCYKKALEFLSSSGKIDLVVVNSEILNMDGLNFIAELNQNGNAKTALKIILGSFDRNGTEAQTRDFGFGMVDGFIEKPIKDKDLDRLMYRLAHRDPLAS